jgi:DNA-binding MarR family transcriptional regulator
MKRVIREKTIRQRRGNTETERRETLVLGLPSDEKDFLKIYPLFIEVLEEDLKLKNGRLRLFLWFVSQIKDIKPNAEPLVVANQKEMTEALDVDLRTIQRYLRELLKKGYISRYKGIRSAYVVNPTLIYKGSVSKYFDKRMGKKA